MRKKIPMSECDCDRGVRSRPDPDGVAPMEGECDRCDWEDRCLECGDFDPYGAEGSVTMCTCKAEHEAARIYDESKGD